MKFDKHNDYTIAVKEDDTPKVLLAHRVTFQDLEGYRPKTGMFGNWCRLAYAGIEPKMGDYLVKYEGENEGTNVVVLVGVRRFIEMTSTHQQRQCGTSRRAVMKKGDE